MIQHTDFIALACRSLAVVMCAGALAAAEEKSAAPFVTAQPGRVFQFPRDHGSHPDFRTEWWYVTGHLDATDGGRFGFQATFFRQARALGKETLFLAHAALLDAKSKRFIHEERLARDGWDASSSTTALDARNASWSLRMDADEALHLTATVRAEALLQLELKPAKPLVVFGENGVSRKGASPSAASHYLTFPRLTGSGKVIAGGATHEVTATAWMDHEFSSSQLDAGQAGWDWAAMQFFDGAEVMVYRMRRADGSSDPAGSTLAWIDAKSAVRHVKADAFTWKPLRIWTSPHTKAGYPVSARIECEGKSFTLRPLSDDQELGGEISGLPYWEGACDVLDAGGHVIGRAFLELAGYAGDLAGQLRGAGP